MPFDPAQPKPRCIQELLQRVEQGTTTKDDADFLLEVMGIASMKIANLEMRVALLQRRLTTLH